MTEEQWQAAWKLYQAAGSMSDEEVDVLLDTSAGSPEIREAVLRMRQAGEAVETRTPAGDTSGDNGTAFAPAASSSSAGTVIGRYLLIEKIGEGGMGEVWLAEQQEPVRRRVALKLIKAGMSSREVIHRFESERQALALMDHPGIARVFDAGSTPQGTPYFVMEYARGEPITTYCDRRQLSTRDRLELFRQLCEAVQHAHQKAIIHRDLKPSNILVTEVDGRPMPKVIDFGIAKALGQKLTGETLFTKMGALIGTPEYVSPEQALSSGEDIDTRTDVYSLGVVFYELLAGVRPIELNKIPLAEFLQRLREDDPPRPSTRVTTQDPAASTEVARKRQTEPAALSRQLNGDLDAIALKALEKDRSRRYASPSEFAEDVARYLRNEAVLAVAPSVAYRARKFARRHRAAVIATSAVLLVLLAATFISIRQSVRASREAAVAQAVNDFLQNDLLSQASIEGQSSRSAKLDPNLTVRTVLDRAAARIGGKFDRQPEVEAAIRDTIGSTYLALGLFPEARRQLERALELQRQVLGDDDRRTLRTMNYLANVAYRQGRYPDAEQSYRQILEIRRRTLGETNRATLASLSNVALCLHAQGKFPDAEKILRQTLDIRTRMLGRQHPDTINNLDSLAIVCYEQAKFAEAEPLFRECTETGRRVLNPEDPLPVNAQYHLALMYQADGRLEESEKEMKQVLEIRRRVLGSEHPDTLLAAAALSGIYLDMGRYADSESLYPQVLETQRRVLGPEHAHTFFTQGFQAQDYLMQHKWGQAEAAFNHIVEGERRVLGPEHPYTLDTVYHRSYLYLREGKLALADADAAQVLAGDRQVFGSDHPFTMSIAARTAAVYLAEAKFREAQALAREALAFYQKKQPDKWERFFAESLLGAAMAGEKQYAEAEPPLLEGYQGMLAHRDRINVPDTFYLDRAHDWLVALYRASGRPEKAAEWKIP